MPEPEWVTIKDAADFTRTSKRTVWRIIKKAGLETTKDPNQADTLVKITDLFKAITDTKKRNTPQGA